MSEILHLDRQNLDDALKQLTRFRIKLEELEIDSAGPSNRGGFGVVRLADYHSEAGTVKVAVKDLISDYTTLPLRTAYRLAREMIVWAKLVHPNILRFIGYHLSDDLTTAYLVSPMISKGNVKQFIERTDPPMEKRMDLVVGTLKGLQYLHGLEPPVCHGDLKSANILVTDDEVALLCDFGLATVMDSELANLATANDFKGSTRWCSPEVLMGEARSPQSDIWSWGCLALEVVTGQLPYQSIANDSVVIYKITINKENPDVGNTKPIPANLLLLLKKCWIWDKDLRPDVNGCASVLAGRKWSNSHWLDGWLMEYVMDIERAVAQCVQQAQMSPEDARRLHRTSQRTTAEMQLALDETNALLEKDQTILPEPSVAYLQLKIRTLTDAINNPSQQQGRPAPPNRPSNQANSTLGRRHSFPANPGSSNSDGREDPSRDVVWEILCITSTLRKPVVVDRGIIGDMLRRLSKLAREFAPYDTTRKLTRSLLANFTRLTRSYPNDFDPDIARFLIEDFYDFRIRRGDYAVALQAAQEAVERYRELSAQSPNYLDDLVGALEKVKTVLCLLARDSEALPVTKEAVSIYTQLRKESPVKFAPALARALVNYYECMCRTGAGDSDFALQVLQQAIELYRGLVVGRSGSERFEHALASALCDYDVALVKRHRKADVLAVKDELVQLYNGLGETDEANEVEKSKAPRAHSPVRQLRGPR